MAKNTPKQRVLKKYPKAYAKEGLMSGDWYVFRESGKVVGKGWNARDAWADADMFLKRYGG